MRKVEIFNTYKNEGKHISNDLLYMNHFFLQFKTAVTTSADS